MPSTEIACAALPYPCCTLPGTDDMLYGTVIPVMIVLMPFCMVLSYSNYISSYEMPGTDLACGTTEEGAAADSFDWYPNFTAPPPLQPLTPLNFLIAIPKYLKRRPALTPSTKRTRYL